MQLPQDKMLKPSVQFFTSQLNCFTGKKHTVWEGQVNFFLKRKKKKIESLAYLADNTGPICGISCFGKKASYSLSITILKRSYQFAWIYLIAKDFCQVLESLSRARWDVQSWEIKSGWLSRAKAFLTVHSG